GIDIVGPLPIAPGGTRFLVMAIDYLTKWVEAKLLISTTGKHMEKFMWEHIVCKFGVPQILIFDNGKQFVEGYYNKRVRPSTFKPGTYVLQLNSISKEEFQGKMGPTWEGPYIVKKAHGDGAYKLETLSDSPIYQTWNGSNLRKFYV
ncbi:reverse transcriptase domain-containing protein, partial [Tanacetum coccineum]